MARCDSEWQLVKDPATESHTRIIPRVTSSPSTLSASTKIRFCFTPSKLNALTRILKYRSIVQMSAVIVRSPFSTCESHLLASDHTSVIVSSCQQASIKILFPRITGACAAFWLLQRIGLGCACQGIWWSTCFSVPPHRFDAITKPAGPLSSPLDRPLPAAFSASHPCSPPLRQPRLS